MASKKSEKIEASAANNESKGLSKKGKWQKIAISLIVFLVLQEVILRLVFPLPELSNFNRINYQVLDSEGAEGPGYLRNIKMTWQSSLDTNAVFVHDFNGYGYRDKEWNIEKDGRKRIFFIGDSFVEGMMANREEGITESFLESALDSGQDYDVFNCGMMGTGLNEYMKFMVDAVPIFKPDEVFLVLTADDLPFQKAYEPASSLVPEPYAVWRPRILEIIRSANSGASIPFLLNRKTRRFHEPVPAPANPWTYNAPNLTKQVSGRIAQAMRLGEFNFYRTNEILQEERFLKTAPDVSTKLAYIKNFLNQHGAKLNVFYIPTRSQVTDFYYQFERQVCLASCPDYLILTTEPYQIQRKVLASESQKLDFTFFDLTEIVKREEDQYNHLYWDYDDHMKAKGYRLIGKTIFDFWSQ